MFEINLMRRINNQLEELAFSICPDTVGVFYAFSKWQSKNKESCWLINKTSHFL